MWRPSFRCRALGAADRTAAEARWLIGSESGEAETGIPADPKAIAAMERRKAERIDKALSCVLVIGDRRHPGIVVDLSPMGLFVQTSVSPPPGERVRVVLRREGVADVEVEASVARTSGLPRRTASVARSGVGLRIESISDDYRQLLHSIPQPEEAPPRPAKETEEAPPCSTVQTEEAPSPERTAAGPPPKSSRSIAYRVRAQQTSGSCYRTLQISAASEEEARDMASARLDEGWEILSVDPSRA